jgi:pantothenate synthetase
VRLDYSRDREIPTLWIPVEIAERGTLVAVAAYVGNTRLIDNLLISPD